MNRLMTIIKSKDLYMGEKDYQQLSIIRKLVHDLKFETNIVAVGTVRDNDGLALSSRNKKLDISSQKIATNLFKALSFAKNNFNRLDVVKVYEKIQAFLKTFPEINIEYFIIADEQDLKPVKIKRNDKKYRAFIAADISGVRLIDNIKLY